MILRFFSSNNLSWSNIEGPELFRFFHIFLKIRNWLPTVSIFRESSNKTLCITDKLIWITLNFFECLSLKNSGKCLYFEQMTRRCIYLLEVLTSRWMWHLGGSWLPRVLIIGEFWYSSHLHISTLWGLCHLTPRCCTHWGVHFEFKYSSEKFGNILRSF